LPSDAAARNVQALDTWLAIARARSAQGVLRALRKWQGLPWNDTLVAGRAGRALCADVRVAPDVSDALVRRCNVDLGQPPFAATGLAVLSLTARARPAAGAGTHVPWSPVACLPRASRICSAATT